jgi:hypothetical protein
VLVGLPHLPYVQLMIGHQPFLPLFVVTGRSR